MDLNISYRHMDSTASIEEKIKEKAEHLKKYFHGNMKVDWVCNIDGDIHVSEVDIHTDGAHFHATSKDDSLYKTIDHALHKIEKQIRKKSEVNRIHPKH